MADGLLSLGLRGMFGVFLLLTISCDGPGAKTNPEEGSLTAGGDGNWFDQVTEGGDDGWKLGTPQDAGLSVGMVEQLKADLRAGEYRNLHAVLIAHNDRIVFEQYLEGEDNRWGRPLGLISFTPETRHDLRSMSKSVTSLVLGIALGSDFEQALDTPVIDYFPEWRDGAAKGVETVKLRHVLTMTAGLQWNESDLPYTNPRNDGIRFLREREPVKFVLRRPIREPAGSRWYYNGGLTMVLGDVVERITKKRLDVYAKEFLFEPLGIGDVEWLGNPSWRPSGKPSADSGLRLRARDVLKLGVLVLNGGKWKQRQIVSPEWIEASTQRHVVISDWMYDYGYHWWYSELKRADLTGRVIAAVGRGGQLLFVLPERDLVIVVFAGNYDNPRRPFAGELILNRVVEGLDRGGVSD